MHFEKNRTLSQKEKAYKTAIDELEAHRASTAGLKRQVVLAEAGVGDLAAAIEALAENARAIEAGETKLNMLRSDLYGHLENDIREAKEKLPLDEAELAATHQALEAELIEKLTRCEALVYAMGYEWLPVAERFKNMRADIKHPLKFQRQNFEDIADFQQEATRISRLQKADIASMARDQYVMSTKRAGRGEKLPADLAKKKAA